MQNSAALLAAFNNGVPVSTKRRMQLFIEKVAHTAADKIKSTPEGKRNSALFSTAARLAGFVHYFPNNIDLEHYREVLEIAGGMAGLDADEIRETINSGFATGEVSPANFNDELDALILAGYKYDAAVKLSYDSDVKRRITNSIKKQHISFKARKGDGWGISLRDSLVSHEYPLDRRKEGQVDVDWFCVEMTLIRRLVKRTGYRYEDSDLDDAIAKVLSGMHYWIFARQRMGREPKKPNDFVVPIECNTERDYLEHLAEHAAKELGEISLLPSRKTHVHFKKIG